MTPLAVDTMVSGRYRLLGRIGAGGMADVWAADDQMLGRRVALKFLLPRYTEDEQFVERFRREAAAAAGLQHPNVVGVFDRGEHEGTPFIAMEYVQGASLKDLIDRGLSVGEAVEITRQVLAGARFAHSKGIIHRDLKPQNVLVDGEGRARVADFGIARAGSSEITQTGSVLGTAQYLSPEQAQGLPVTAASDLYSVGAMLYEALTGQVPFDADTPVAVALKQVSEQPRPPSELNPKVPPALDAVVLKALAKDPANRFTSADDFLRALDSAEADPAGGGGNTATYAAVGAAAAAVGAGAPGAAASGDTQPPPVPPEDEGFWTRNRIIAAAVIAALLIAGALVFFLTRGGTSQGAVPKVTGELLSRATEELKKQGFTVITSPTPSRVRVNEVIEQDPRAGTLADKGTAVTLSVSTGPGVGTVPNVVGKTAAQAEKILQTKGFKSKLEPKHSSAPKGQVTGQDPAPNSQTSRGSTVTLTVSSGQNFVSVPSVVGQQQGAALTLIRNAGLTPHSVTQAANQPAGEVIDESPLGGSQAPRGSTVTITVSNGAGTVVVPNVVGQPQASAESTLRSNGVRRITVLHQTTTDPSQDGQVISQAPSAGTRIRDTDSVTITVGRVSNQQQSVLVPVVTGQPQSTAETVLRNAGLKPQVQRQSSTSVPSGSVISENPSAGTSVPMGSTVTIVVSTGP